MSKLSERFANWREWSQAEISRLRDRVTALEEAERRRNSYYKIRLNSEYGRPGCAHHMSVNNQPLGCQLAQHGLELTHKHVTHDGVLYLW